MRRAPASQKPERSNPDVGARASIVAEYRQERLPAAGFQREHHPHGGRLQRCFYNGLDALDNGEKLDKTIRRDKEEEPEPKRPDLRIQADGQALRIVRTRGGQGVSGRARARRMLEVRIGKTKHADDKRHLWEQAASYARGYSSPEKQQGRHPISTGEITGEWPDRSWTVANTPSVPITRAVLNKIRSRNIAYAKARMAA